MVFNISDNNLYTGNTQKNGAVSKVIKKLFSHTTMEKHTLSAAEPSQISYALH
jgi:hypothetical protein